MIGTNTRQMLQNMAHLNGGRGVALSKRSIEELRAMGIDGPYCEQPDPAKIDKDGFLKPPIATMEQS